MSEGYIIGNVGNGEANILVNQVGLEAKLKNAICKSFFFFASHPLSTSFQKLDNTAPRPPVSGSGFS